MRKMCFTVVLAIALLGVAVGSASASRLSFLNGERGFTFDWTAVEISNNVNSEVIRCHVQLEGSFALRSMAKRDRAVIGVVTRAVANECSAGTLIMRTLPWNMRYRGFGGTLPTITALLWDIPNLEFNIESAGGVRCESNAEDANPARGTALLGEAGGGLRRVTEVRAEESTGIPARGGIFGSCGWARVFFRGTATSSVLGESAAIVVALTGTATPLVEPSPVDFGTVEPESTTRRTMTIESGEGTTVENITVRNGTNFSITDPNSCRGRRLAARTTCRFTAIFDAPATEGRSYEDTIVVETSARRIEVNARGRTRDPVPPTAEPEPVAFGRLETRTLARREVTLRAASEVTINSIALNSGTYFAIVDPNRCIGARLARSATCTFNVLVETPEEAGRPLSDTLLIGNSIRQIEDRVTAET